MNKSRMQKRGDKDKPSQREDTHFNMSAVNVRSLVVVFIVVVGHDLPVQTS